MSGFALAGLIVEVRQSGQTRQCPLNSFGSLTPHLLREFRCKRMAGNEVNLGLAQLQFGAPAANARKIVPSLQVATPAPWFFRCF